MDMDWLFSRPFIPALRIIVGTLDGAQALRRSPEYDMSLSKGKLCTADDQIVFLRHSKRGHGMVS